MEGAGRGRLRSAFWKVHLGQPPCNRWEKKRGSGSLCPGGAWHPAWHGGVSQGRRDNEGRMHELPLGALVGARRFAGKDAVTVLAFSNCNSVRQKQSHSHALAGPCAPESPPGRSLWLPGGGSLPPASPSLPPSRGASPAATPASWLPRKLPWARLRALGPLRRSIPAWVPAWQPARAASPPRAGRPARGGGCEHPRARGARIPPRARRPHLTCPWPAGHTPGLPLPLRSGAREPRG